jgi:L-seryl-tRNA(Ser) seleniumtransferase
MAYVKRDHDAIPVLRMMRMPREEIGRRAEAIAARLQGDAVRAAVIDGDSVLGGGSAPSATLPTRVLAVTSERLSADQLASRLRGFDPPIIARVEDGRVLLDLRSVFPEQDEHVAASLLRLAE